MKLVGCDNFAVFVIAAIRAYMVRKLRCVALRTNGASCYTEFAIC